MWVCHLHKTLITGLTDPYLNKHHKEMIICNNTWGMEPEGGKHKIATDKRIIWKIKTNKKIQNFKIKCKNVNEIWIHPIDVKPLYLWQSKIYFF